MANARGVALQRGEDGRDQLVSDLTVFERALRACLANPGTAEIERARNQRHAGTWKSGHKYRSVGDVGNTQGLCGSCLTKLAPFSQIDSPFPRLQPCFASCILAILPGDTS